MAYDAHAYLWKRWWSKTASCVKPFLVGPFLSALCKLCMTPGLQFLCTCYIRASWEAVASKTKQSGAKEILGSLKIMVGEDRGWKMVTHYDTGQSPLCGSTCLMTRPPHTSSDSSQVSLAFLGWHPRPSVHAAPSGRITLLASDLRTSAHPVCPAASLLRDQGLAGARSGAPHMLFFSPEVFLAGKFYTLSVTHMHTILAHLGGQ